MEDIKQKALDALIIMNTAIKNLRLYPSTSAKIINAIEKLHRTFLDMLEKKESLIFEKSEKNVLLCGEALSQAGQEKWQVTALLKILLDFGIKNIIFNKGLEKEELNSFMEILSKRPENMKDESDLSRIMKGRNISHITLDKKVEVPGKIDKQVLSPLNITDDKIIQFLMRLNPKSADDPRKLQEMTNKPDFLLQTFQSGLSEIMTQKENLSKLQISESMVNMITLLDKLAASFEKKDQDKISQQIGTSIAAMDPDIVQQLKAQKIEHLFGGTLAKYLARETIQDKAVKPLTSSAGAPVKTKSPEPVVLQQKPDPQSQIIQLKEKLRALPKDDQKPFLDAPMMSALPKLFEQLNAQKEHEAMAIIISRLIGNMFSNDPDVRLQASTALAEIFEGLTRERQDKLITRLSTRLLDWIKIEPLATLAYKKICNNLKDLIHDFILQGRFAEAIPILDVFSNISAGIMEKNDKAYEICLDIIRELASEEHLTILFEAFSTNNPDKQVESGGILVRLGDGSMNRLLDILRDKVDSDERVRIMNLFIGMGRRALPVVRDRISKVAPWYYLRNLAYILGHIGNESSAGALQPLLSHENKRLRLEALKSIYKTGGNERAHILLSVLPFADDQFKLNIIETIGNAKCVEAVPELVKMLKKRKAIASALRTNLEEKICAALGSIGSPEALPILLKITKSNFFLSIRRYSEKVKITAGLAVVSIRKKQEEVAEALDEVEVAS